MKDSPLFLVILALIAVCGTLGGVWLGRYLERDNDAMKWRRDHALQAYSEFLRLIDTISEESSRAYQVGCDSESHSTYASAASEKVLELLRSGHGITLLSTDDLHGPYSDLIRYMPEFAGILIKCPKASDAEVKAAKSKLSELLASFTMNARNDLGIHPRNQLWKSTRRE